MTPKTKTSDSVSIVPLMLSGDAEHTLRNHLAIVIGFSDVLLHEMSVADSIFGDIAEIRAAASAALVLLNDASVTDADG